MGLGGDATLLLCLDDWKGGDNSRVVGASVIVKQNKSLMAPLKYEKYSFLYELWGRKAGVNKGMHRRGNSKRRGMALAAALFREGE